MENKFTRLTLEQNDLKVTWEVPYEDVTGNDMVLALRTIMVGMTFHPNTFTSALANYLQEYADDEYWVSKKNSDNYPCDCQMINVEEENEDE